MANIMKNPWKIILLVYFPLSVLAIVALALAWLASSIDLTFTYDNLADAESRIETMSTLLKGRVTRDELLEAAQETATPYEYPLTGTTNVLLARTVCIHFDADGKVAEVE